MKQILVTGSEGFVGKNLCVALSRLDNVVIQRFDKENSIDELKNHLDNSDYIFHVAGVNRPKDENEFVNGNIELTEIIVTHLIENKKKTPIVFTSTIQAELDNPYGKSKKEAENVLRKYNKETDADLFIYRLHNLFGKWSRPNYNSVISTFCYNISHDLEIKINNAEHNVEFVYIDDLINTLIKTYQNEVAIIDCGFYSINKTYICSLGELAEKIYSFRDIKKTNILPDLSDPFTKYLYSTYLSYIETDQLVYPVDMKHDDRGWLFEFIKSEKSGQIFISKTKPGIIRGNHHHDTKVEKFCVIKGQGLVSLRNILSDEIVSYEVSDEDIRIIDIPPGVTHSIENVGQDEMITIFWANEIFNQDEPDTYWKEV